jgi:hypothetical protein
MGHLHRIRWRWLAAWAWGLHCAVHLTACAPRATEGGFESDNPAAQLYAIRQAGERRDAGAVPRLVTALTSDDPAVRMFAIEALDRITGERLGYNPRASLQERDAAVARWVQYTRRPQEE